jgi:hypothetical protein
MSTPGWTLVLFGLVAIAFSIHWGTKSLTPECDGKTMSEGDNCLVTNNSGTHSNSYQEVLETNQVNRERAPYGVAGGVLGVALGSTILIVSRRKRGHLSGGPG